MATWTSWKVIETVDTRHFDRETGKAIPGSGEPRVCDRCGREHEIWSYVREEQTDKDLITGAFAVTVLRRWIVGTRCAVALGLSAPNRNSIVTRRNGAAFGRVIAKVETAMARPLQGAET